MTLKRLLTIALLTVSLALFGADTIPWKLPFYTLVAREMDLRVALDTFAVAEGLSVVMSPAVAGSFSGAFPDALVPTCFCCWERTGDDVLSPEEMTRV